jgi:hypothetical protein
MKARGKSKSLPSSPALFDGADQANQMLNRLRALFLPGRAGAGAGLKNLVQVADLGFSRQL